MDRRNFLKFCGKGLAILGATSVGLNKLESDKLPLTENIGISLSNLEKSQKEEYFREFDKIMNKLMIDPFAETEGMFWEAVFKGDPNSTCKFKGLDKIINTGHIDV